MRESISNVESSGRSLAPFNDLPGMSYLESLGVGSAELEGMRLRTPVLRVAGGWCDRSWANRRGNVSPELDLRLSVTKPNSPTRRKSVKRTN
jgi:hypothetical protein